MLPAPVMATRASCHDSADVDSLGASADAGSGEAPCGHPGEERNAGHWLATKISKPVRRVLMWRGVGVTEADGAVLLCLSPCCLPCPRSRLWRKAAAMDAIRVEAAITLHIIFVTR